jgi:Zinc knuckle
VRGLDGRTICGRRARVEMSNGKGGGRGYRGPPPRSSRMARPFHPDDRCYECGDRGHYARDCSRLGRRTRRRYYELLSDARGIQVLVPMLIRLILKTLLLCFIGLCWVYLLYQCSYWPVRSIV